MTTHRKSRPFREYIRESIHDPEEAAAYLTAAAEDSDPRVFQIALKDVIAVYGGQSELARKTGLNRGNLNKMLSGMASPRFDNLHKILNATGFAIAIQPITAPTPGSGDRPRT